MPELAEVERGRRLLEQAILQKKIVSVHTKPEETRVYVGDSARALSEGLPGRTVLGVKRLGKNIYLELDGEGCTLAFHLGMTGCVAIKDGEMHYRRPKFIKRMQGQWPPWRWKIILTMQDGTEVATTDSSRFGRVRAVLAKDASTVPPLSLLARDAWLNCPSHDEMCQELLCRTAPVKTVLLDQNAVFCGLGNYLTDEILFHARIHPRQPAYALSPEQTYQLHLAVTQVLTVCISSDADTKLYPKTWLYPHRYGRKGGIGQTFKMADGNMTQVTHDRIGGRITALTSVQILGDYSHVPLPKRRKVTKIEVEEEEDAVVDLNEAISAPVKMDKVESKKRKRVASPGDVPTPLSGSTTFEADQQEQKKKLDRNAHSSVEEPGRRRSKRISAL